MKKNQPKPVSDYLLIAPDRPTAGSFTVGDTYLNETGVLVDCGDKVSQETKALKGKKIIFNAWACDVKEIAGEKYYFAPESANCICAVI